MKSTVAHFLKTNKTILLIAILLIFYTVGTIGIAIPKYSAYFLSLSSLNLLLSFSILFIATEKNYRSAGMFFILCFLVGIGVELIGTKTGLLFGSYAYGETLVFKFEGVPLVIGLNWWVLVVCSAAVINYIPNLSLVTKVLLSSLLMTMFDVLMEPIAMKCDFWQWENDRIPMYNYVCWFLTSLPLHFMYFKYNLVETNKVYPTLFFILTLFFSILYFI